MGLWLRPRNQVPILTMEASGITTAKKSSASLQQCESDADLFFFYSRGIVHHEHAPEGQTINKEYYLQVLRRLREAVRRKWPDMWGAKNFQLHHDNVLAHSAHVIHAFQVKNCMPLVGQAPHFPDLAPCDFWLFPKLKTILKGRRFHSREDIMKKSTEELGSIPEEEFKRCFEKWQKRWEYVCVSPRGILWRRSNKTCKIRCVVCFIQKIRILFEQTSYVFEEMACLWGHGTNERRGSTNGLSVKLFFIFAARNSFKLWILDLLFFCLC